MVEQGKKKSFWKRNKEKIKIGTICSVSLASIGGVIALIVAHLANPALGFVSIPIAVQTLIAMLIKKAPQTFAQLKAVIEEVMIDLPDDIREKFADELASQITATKTTSRTMSSNEPLNTPSETEEVNLKGLYHKKSKTYEIFTPRITGEMKFQK